MKHKSWLLLWFCWFFIPELKAQDSLQFIHSFPVPEQVAVSADGNGAIFISTTTGEIQKYNQSGQLLNSYSPQSASLFSSIDSRSGMQVRAFDENSQQLVYLDRFLNQSGSIIQLPSELFGFIDGIAWSASGNTVWVFDASDLKLKRWRTDLSEEVSAFKLSPLSEDPLDVKMLYEYQHKLYLFTPTKSLVFDQLGNYEKEILLPSWTDIAFLGDHLLCLSGTNNLELINLYDSSVKRQELKFVPENEGLPYQKVLAGKGGKLYLFTKKDAFVYGLVP